MSIDIDSSSQEWRWCLVGNIIPEHEYGEEHIIKKGTKQFAPDTKVYINIGLHDIRPDHVLVIGQPRNSIRYIEVIIPLKYVCNFRMQQVYKPAVLRRMNGSKWEWWDNTDFSRRYIIKILAWLNPDEAEREKNRWNGYSDERPESNAPQPSDKCVQEHAEKPELKRIQRIQRKMIIELVLIGVAFLILMVLLFTGRLHFLLDFMARNLGLITLLACGALLLTSVLKK